MINLFHIPQFEITERFDNLLHGKIVREFEESFASYVGAKYAVSFNSASSALFLIFKEFIKDVEIPSIIPPVVVNAAVNAGVMYKFTDNIKWVGHYYCLHPKLIDSAQEVEKGFYNKLLPDVMVVYSFYPTKPVGSIDGGMVVCDDLDTIERLRELSMNGMTGELNNWERKQNRVGWKVYMNSIQAYIGLENLKRLDEKKEALRFVRLTYNNAFELNNTSEHLYRINVDNRDKFMADMKQKGIQTGIHYRAQHLNPLFLSEHLPLSEAEEKTTVSIPFHERLTVKEIKHIINAVKERV